MSGDTGAGSGGRRAARADVRAARPLGHDPNLACTKEDLGTALRSMIARAAESDRVHGVTPVTNASNLGARVVPLGSDKPVSEQDMSCYIQGTEIPSSDVWDSLLSKLGCSDDERRDWAQCHFFK
ncbi:MAG: hypothetical protein ACRDRH_27040 [Pseudonocardia sp.]